MTRDTWRAVAQEAIENDEPFVAVPPATLLSMLEPWAPDGFALVKKPELLDKGIPIR